MRINARIWISLEFSMDRKKNIGKGRPIFQGFSFRFILMRNNQIELRAVQQYLEIKKKIKGQEKRT